MARQAEVVAQGDMAACSSGRQRDLERETSEDIVSQGVHDRCEDCGDQRPGWSETKASGQGADLAEVMHWLDIELRPRLVAIEEQVSRIAERGGGCGGGGGAGNMYGGHGPAGRVGGRRSLLRCSGFFDPPMPISPPSPVVPLHSAPEFGSSDDLDLGGGKVATYRTGRNRLNQFRFRQVPPCNPRVLSALGVGRRASTGMPPLDLDGAAGGGGPASTSPREGTGERPGHAGAAPCGATVTAVMSSLFSAEDSPSSAGGGYGGAGGCGDRFCANNSRELRRKKIMENMDSARLRQVVEIHQRFAGRQRCVVSLWRFLEEPESSRAASWYAKFVPIVILLSVFLAILQSGDPPPLHGLPPAFAEISIDVFFLAEVLVRWAVSPRFFRFLLSGYNLVDLTAAVSLPLRISVMLYQDVTTEGISPTSDMALPAWVRAAATFLLCAMPLMRLLKILRRFEKVHLLYQAFEIALEALPVLLFTGAVILFTFSAFIFLVEARDNIESLPRAMWLSVVTMTTVGYGDYSPKSTQGTFITSCLIVASSLYMSIPLGIVGNAFNRVWEDRDRLLLMERTKKRLDEWGYTPRDINTFFQLFSTTGDGVLDFYDFEKMMEEMQLGLSPQRVQQLFELFDDDGSGSIEPEEFVAVLFPHAVYEAGGEALAAARSANSYKRGKNRRGSALSSSFGCGCASSPAGLGVSSISNNDLLRVYSGGCASSTLAAATSMSSATVPASSVATATTLAGMTAGNFSGHFLTGKSRPASLESPLELED